MAPLIDRELLKDRHGKDRGHASRIIVLATAFAVVLAVCAFAGLIALVADNGVPQPSEPPARIPARVSYTIHDPILINGNADFTTENGVSGGDGSISDPYIIADWDINASSSTGIFISDTDAHFIIRNCYVYDGMSPSWLYTWDGIYLENCTNGTIEYNTCSNNYAGIYIEISRNITVVGNNCSSNEDTGIGVGGYSSRNNTLYDNICNFNQDGISIGFAGNNTLANNTCTYDYYGIGIYSSHDNRLVNNTCTHNEHGIHSEDSYGNNLTDNNCSLNNDIGIYLASSSDNNTLSNNICSFNQYGVELVSSAGNKVCNNTCISNDESAIDLSNSNDNTISDNNFSLSRNNGIWLAVSSNNSITRNQLHYNGALGVMIEDSGCSDNKIWNNTFIGNNGASGAYDPSHIQAYDDGTNNRWNSTDGRGNHWSDWTGPDADMNGIVDQPYQIDGGSGAMDYYPLATPVEPIPEFGMFPAVVIAMLAFMILMTQVRNRRGH